jgi:hypothetical protein
LIDKEIELLLQADILEAAQSSWNANIVYVENKIGDWRICIDMRRLNLAHKPYIDKFPLSRIDQGMNAL